jgi:protein-S-isoprenylcysteine O-methyltransferase Ste14
MKAVNKRVGAPPDFAPGTRRWLVKNIIFFIIPVAVLLAASGRLSWGMGWAYIAIVTVNMAVNGYAVVTRNPDLIEERSKMQAGTKSWDKWLSILVAFVLPAFVWLIAGLDQRFGWSQGFSLSVQVLSLVIVLVGGFLTTWAMAVNRFFSGTVRIQTERAHTIVRGGPYEYVRHPGYAGTLLFMLLTPLALGSWYKKYTKRVKFRLIPYIW